MKQNISPILITKINLASLNWPQREFLCELVLHNSMILISMIMAIILDYHVHHVHHPKGPLKFQIMIVTPWEAIKAKKS